MPRNIGSTSGAAKFILLIYIQKFLSTALTDGLPRKWDKWLELFSWLRWDIVLHILCGTVPIVFKLKAVSLLMLVTQSVLI
jgi:hypothetical protein